MSLVNRMLRDLDTRQAIGAAPADMPPGQVRAVPRSAARHEWFWRMVAALLLVSVAWVVWVTYQLRPRPALATPLALSAAEEAKHRPALSTPEQPEATPPAQPEPQPQVAAVPQPPAPLEFLKLAQLIETPIPDHPATNPKSTPPRPATGPVSLTPPASLSKRNRPRTADGDAESLFREGVGMLNQGRVTEAQQDFAAALKRYPTHEAARQALVSILIDRGQLRTHAGRSVEGVDGVSKKDSPSTRRKHTSPPSWRASTSSSATTPRPPTCSMQRAKRDAMMPTTSCCSERCCSGSGAMRKRPTLCITPSS